MVKQTKKSLRETYIDTIMINKYGVHGNSSVKSTDPNLTFLQSLTLKELANMASTDFDDEFDVRGEVTIDDFDDNEIDFENEV